MRPIRNDKRHTDRFYNDRKGANIFCLNCDCLFYSLDHRRIRLCDDCKGSAGDNGAGGQTGAGEALLIDIGQHWNRRQFEIWRARLNDEHRNSGGFYGAGILKYEKRRPGRA